MSEILKQFVSGGLLAEAIYGLPKKEDDQKQSTPSVAQAKIDAGAVQPVPQNVVPSAAGGSGPDQQGGGEPVASAEPEAPAPVDVDAVRNAVNDVSIKIDELRGTLNTVLDVLAGKKDEPAPADGQPEAGGAGDVAQQMTQAPSEPSAAHQASTELLGVSQ
jgi:hypothetical protein